MEKSSLDYREKLYSQIQEEYGKLVYRHIKKRLGLKSDKSLQNRGFKNWWTKSKMLEKPRKIKQN